MFPSLKLQSVGFLWALSLVIVTVHSAPQEQGWNGPRRSQCSTFGWTGTISGDCTPIQICVPPRETIKGGTCAAGEICCTYLTNISPVAQFQSGMTIEQMKYAGNNYAGYSTYYNPGKK